jgi:DNA polymerase-3 subunit delta'
LKALEEPPANGLFLVISHQPGRLLPTIRSRCRMLRMMPLSDSDIARLMADAMAGAAPARGRGRAADPSEEERLQIAQLAEGSAGRALSLAGGGGLDLYKEIARLLSGLPRLDIAGVHALADKAGRKGSDDQYEAMVELITLWLQRLIRAGAGLDTGLDIVPGEGASMARLAAGGSLDRWVEVWEKVVQSTVRGEALNTDRKLVILNAFSMLEEAASMRAGA